MNTIDASVLARVAVTLSALGLSEICSLTVETNGATGGVDVIAEGVEGEEIDGMPVIVTRKLMISSFGDVEVVS
jgi:hypothetical protein